MFRICIYKGYGMYESDGRILYRVLSKYVCSKKYSVSYVSPEDILSGTLNNETALFVIGGGFDLGLIKVLGPKGMAKIKSYVTNGGSYLGMCSGAYFACDYIEFDKGGSLEVIGERFLKFYPGHSYGPLYKPYDYQTRSGASSSSISFQPELQPCVDGLKNINGEPGKQTTKMAQFVDLFEKNGISRLFKVYFNGGGWFVGRNENTPQKIDQTAESHVDEVKNAVCENNKGRMNDHDGIGFENVTVLARYADLESNPAAIVKCLVDKGTAVLSGVHFEYDAIDIDDGDVLVESIIPELKQSEVNRKYLILSILKDLNITTQESQ